MALRLERLVMSFRALSCRLPANARLGSVSRCSACAHQHGDTAMTVPADLFLMLLCRQCVALWHTCSPGYYLWLQMEGMVTDLQLAREKQQMFEDWKDRTNKQLAIDLSVTVLTTGFWPTYKAMDLMLPQEMVEGIEAFKEFYEAETKHRKLTWIYTQGTCQLKGNFDARAIEMVLSTLQVSQGCHLTDCLMGT